MSDSVTALHVIDVSAKAGREVTAKASAARYASSWPPELDEGRRLADDLLSYNYDDCYNTATKLKNFAQRKHLIIGAIRVIGSAWVAQHLTRTLVRVANSLYLTVSDNVCRIPAQFGQRTSRGHIDGVSFHEWN